MMVYKGGFSLIFESVSRRIRRSLLFFFRVKSRSSSVPLELVFDILRRLPAKDVLRCRCVSKQWRSLVDHPDFVAAHLLHSASTLDVLLLIQAEGELLYTVSLESLDASVPLTPPLMGEMEVVGSSNGLVCVSSTTGQIVIWNPSTRRHRLVPYPALLALKARGYNVRASGFGYDAIHDDYKLIWVDQSRERAEAYVYSLRTNTWTRMADLPHRFLENRASIGVCVGGAMHWKVGYLTLLAVDLGAEGYRELPWPAAAEQQVEDLCATELGVLRGCLCFTTCTRYYERTDMWLRVWVMEEYGKNDSWTEMISVSQYGIPRYRNPRSTSWLIYPLAYSKCGDKIFFKQNGGRLSFCKQMGGPVSFWWVRSDFDIQIGALPLVYGAHIFVGCLVPVEL